MCGQSAGFLAEDRLRAGCVAQAPAGAVQEVGSVLRGGSDIDRGRSEGDYAV